MQRVALGSQGCREQGLPRAQGQESRPIKDGGLGGTLTVHVISMLFFLVPSPFTSAGLDSGAGTQMDAKFKSNSLHQSTASHQTLSLPCDPSLLCSVFSQHLSTLYPTGN